MTKYNSAVSKFFIALVLLMFSTLASAFTVKNIRVEGANRIRVDTVLSYVSVKKGQDFNQAKSKKLIQKLYNTGFFTDVRLLQRGNTLVIRVSERPVIYTVRVKGNKLIKTDDITKVLKDNGLSEGAVYNPAKFRGIKVALEQQYFNLGRYNAVVDTKIENKGQGRVAIQIDIYEGQTAKIKKITLVGNRAYKESNLLRQFNLTSTHLWSPLFHNDQYSREKLNADIELLRSYYMDRGYINFRIESVQVSITPDKRHVYITININEGDIYTLRSYSVLGDINAEDRKAVTKLITMKRGKPFSRGDIISSTKQVNAYFQDRGFAYAKVDVQPDVNPKNHQIDIDYVIKPGMRVYVRRVSFVGNSRTQDQVFRRQMRQFEGALYSQAKVKLSKRKIDNLGFVEKVQVAKMPVPGHPDQIDIAYKMSETSTASARAQVGYSDAVGFVFGAGLNQKNFLGTGKGVGINFEKNSAYRNLNLSYYNPFATISGIGYGFNVFYNQTTPGRVGTANYTTNSYGANLKYAFPISEYNMITVGAGYTHLDFAVDRTKASKEMIVFVRTNGEMCDPSLYPPSYFTEPYDNNASFEQFVLSLTWNDSDLDRAIYPTQGYQLSAGGQLGVPVTHDSLPYYKLSFSGSYYYPLAEDWIVHTKARVSFGDGIGRLSCLPFFLNYHAGGMDTVRGLDDNSLGPLDSRGKSLGGNLLTAGSLELIFPNPLGERVRTRGFIDAGNVYDNRFVFSDLRLTGGVQVDWISPFGPLRFSFGYPIVQFSGDKKKLFQFSIGTSL